MFIKSYSLHFYRKFHVFLFTIMCMLINEYFTENIQNICQNPEKNGSIDVNNNYRPKLERCHYFR